MSDPIKHECGIAQLRLLKPLNYYKNKYGTAFYGLNKLYLMMEKQHNRGQDGAGLASVKFDMQPGERFMSRGRSKEQQPIQDVFTKINNRINGVLKEHPEYKASIEELKENIPYIGEVYMGHVRYGSEGHQSIENVHPFLRQNNWMHRNLILAGNFNMTNLREQFNYLVQLGQHPKARTSSVTVLEKIGHFLDTEVDDIYRKLREEGVSKHEASPHIAEQLDIIKILQKSAEDWDGGYVISGLLGHGDSFVIRDPSGIRPAFYYKDDEIMAVASERPALQTTFDLKYDEVAELPPGHAIITKKNGETSIEKILEPLQRKSCSFERIYFSRGNDAEIYRERKNLGKMVMPQVLKAIDYDTVNSVFSYIPNTAETSFFGMVEAAQDELNHQKNQEILNERESLTERRLSEILSRRLRTEKIAVKDVKLRTFITEGSSRDDLVAHVYDVTYGVVKPNDNLVIIDDSIVRGTTLKKSILQILDRLDPKKIVVVSSAPQIRYPDCYGIEMARFEEFAAFRAALALLQETNQYHIVDEVYRKCKSQLNLKDNAVKNYVKEIYSPFSVEQLSDKIAEMLSNATIKAEIKVIYQSIENLHRACPKNRGDWYFTGNYPTPGGNRVVNRAFINFYENREEALLN